MRAATYILVMLFGLASSVLGAPQTMETSSPPTASEKAQALAQEQQREDAQKSQKKAPKNAQKAQKKAQKQWNQQHPSAH